ncbi:MAG: hypothetical protein ACTSQO_04200 [Candidatus Helarchaeota archaeon]
MILGVYIFINYGKKFVFRKELEKFDEDTLDLINKTILNIVNKFDRYEQGIYKILMNDIKILFAVYGEVLSIVLIKEEKILGEEDLPIELINASDSLFSSIIFNQPLLVKLIEQEAGIENFSFYSRNLPDEKNKIFRNYQSSYQQLKTNKSINYVKNLDSIFNEVNTKLTNELKNKELKIKKEELIVQKVLSNFVELTFRYVKMYLMENLIRDLINDHTNTSITDIKMGINDFLFYFRKSIHILRERPEIQFFLKIMDSKKFGIQIKNRTAFTILFLEEAIDVTNGINNKDPLISFNSVDVVVNLILGKLEMFEIATSNQIKIFKLHEFVKIIAPLVAVLIRLYEKKDFPGTLSIKRLTMEGFAELIKTLFIINLQNNPKKLPVIRDFHKIISLQITDLGILNLIIDGSQPNYSKIINVKIGPYHKESDIILQSTLKHLCQYANGEISLIKALQNIRLLKGISMNPIDFIKGKTFKQISDLFSLWKLIQI